MFTASESWGLRASETLPEALVIHKALLRMSTRIVLASETVTIKLSIANCWVGDEMKLTRSTPTYPKWIKVGALRYTVRFL